MSSDSVFSTAESPDFATVSAREIITSSSELVASQLEPLNSGEPETALVWLLWALLAGMLTSVIVLTAKFVRCLQRIRSHRVTEFDDEIARLVEQLSQQLRLRRTPRVVVSDVRFGPAVLGVFRHLIVLPKCLVEGMIDSEGSSNGEKSLHPILAHELLHIRRGDLWVGALQGAVVVPSSGVDCEPHVVQGDRMLLRRTGGRRTRLFPAGVRSKFAAGDWKQASAETCPRFSRHEVRGNHIPSNGENHVADTRKSNANVMVERFCSTTVCGDGAARRSNRATAEY